MPVEGDGYCGLINYWSNHESYQEYILTMLDKPLEEGKNYKVDFYVSLADNSEFSLNSIGVCFRRFGKLHKNRNNIIECDNGVLINKNDLELNPDTWTRVTQEFTSTGSEEYLIIGLFSHNKKYIDKQNLVRNNPTEKGTLPYSYLYIDSISVTEIQPVIGD